jgi:hypothetical protein
LLIPPLRFVESASHADGKIMPQTEHPALFLLCMADLLTYFGRPQVLEMVRGVEGQIGAELPGAGFKVVGLAQLGNLNEERLLARYQGRTGFQPQAYASVSRA